jgi:hypothetical protein
MSGARIVLMLVLGAAWLWASSASAAEPSSAAPEILHMPRHESRADSGILRPVPISVALPHGMAVRARRVLVHYRLWGMPDWTTIELRRHGARFEGAIPCLEVSTVTGDLRYYIRVHDIDGAVIATGGSRAKPYRVTIRHDTTLGAKARKVKRCPDPADCPRGLLGCPSEKVIKIQCRSDSDCEGGATCSWEGFCEKVERRRYWVLASVEQDFGVIGRAGACSVPSQENDGYACFKEDGSHYAGNPVLTNEPLGVGLGPTRVVLGFEFLAYYDITVGLRAGWSVRESAPTVPGGVDFVPVSVAGRVSHWFGSDPFGRSGVRPFAFVTGGYAMFDIATEIHVREDPTLPVRQGGNDLEQTLDLYKRAGDGFAGVGTGLMFSFDNRWAAMVEASVLGVFPFSALVIAPSAGLMVGF